VNRGIRRGPAAMVMPRAIVGRGFPSAKTCVRRGFARTPPEYAGCFARPQPDVAIPSRVTEFVIFFPPVRRLTDKTRVANGRLLPSALVKAAADPRARLGNGKLCRLGSTIRPEKNRRPRWPRHRVAILQLLEGGNWGFFDAAGFRGAEAEKLGRARIR